MNITLVQSRNTPTEKRKDIEGMRAIAVMGVVAFHFGLSSLSGGFTGVDVFFVISGYLITKHLNGQIDRTETVNLLAFYASRARRLIPSAVLVIVATLAAGYFFYAPAEQILATKYARYSALYALNWRLFKSAFEYFSPQANLNPYLHFWSLALEEQFYLLWPVVIIFCRKQAKRISLRISLAVIFCASLVACVIVTPISQPLAFYMLPFRAWEFAVGAIIPFMPSAPPIARRLIGYLGIAIIVLSYLLISEEMGFPGWIAVAPAAGAAMIIYAGEVESGRIRVLELLPLQWLGYLSYPLYLWHWPVIVYANSFVEPPSNGERVLLLCITLALSWLTKVLVEEPVRYNRYLGARPGVALIAMLALSASGAASAYGVKSATILSPEQRLITDQAALPSAAGKLNATCLPDVTVDQVITCELGDLRSNKVAVLFGDSHADAWSTALDQAAKESGYKLVTVMKASCSPAEVSTFSSHLHREFFECERWREAAIARIKNLRPSKIIIAEYTYTYVESSVQPSTVPRVSLESFTSGLQKVMTEIATGDTDTYVIKDVPFMRLNVPTCLARSQWRNEPDSICSRDQSRVFDNVIDLAEMSAVLEVPKSHYIDMTDQFCSEGSCHAAIGGLITFHDAHHIAAQFSASLSEKLRGSVFQH